jgi:hypothetical protein
VLIGIDIVRRLGTRALVLVPNSAVQAQRLHAVREFGAPPGLAAAAPDQAAGSSPESCGSATHAEKTGSPCHGPVRTPRCPS